MTNREKLNNTALYDLLMKLHQNAGEAGCIIELLEGALPFVNQLCESYGGCEECLQGYLNEEVNTMTTMDEAARKAADEIKVGDEIDCGHLGKGVVVRVGEDTSLHIIHGSGKSSFNYQHLAKKTGRHFPQVEELLAALGGADDDTAPRS